MNSFAKILVAAGIAAQASAKTIKIDVGESGLTFNPNSVTAAVGDSLEFHFYPKNHSVVLGDWTSGCQPAKSNGFFSGFVPSSSGESSSTFTVKVSSTDPLVFYCSQGQHCKSGMYGVINPSGKDTLEAYGTLAKAATSAGSPASAFGGTLSTGSGSGSGSSSGSGSGTGTASAPSSSSTGSGSGGSYGGGSGSGGSSTTGGSGGSSTSGSSGSNPSQTTKPSMAGTVKAGVAGVLGVAALAVFIM